MGYSAVALERLGESDPSPNPEETPETPLDEPPPPEVRDPPSEPEERGPYIVRSVRDIVG